MTISKMSIVGLVILILTLPMAVLGGDGDFKPGSEPDGFRGIKWGTDISTLKDMELKVKDGLTSMYKRKEDALQVGTANLKSLAYFFWDGKLSGVGFFTQGIDNYNRLKESTFEKFGKGLIPNLDTKSAAQDFRWRGKITEMMLTYNLVNEEGILLMSSHEHLKNERLKKQRRPKDNTNW